MWLKYGAEILKYQFQAPETKNTAILSLLLFIYIWKQKVRKEGWTTLEMKEFSKICSWLLTSLNQKWEDSISIV